MTTQTAITQLRAALDSAIVGQSQLLDRLVVTLLAGGHVLVEGLPGLAKTTAVKSLAEAIHASFQRVQFTPDWLMQPRIDRELAINALLMALWRRQPIQPVIIHSDQGSQFSSHDLQAFLKSHNLVASMSRRGNCHDNAVAESFFQLLKREHIRRKTYMDREEARRDVFDYIEMFYNPKRRHGYANRLSPVEFERQYFNRLESV